MSQVTVEEYLSILPPELQAIEREKEGHRAL